MNNSSDSCTGFASWLSNIITDTAFPIPGGKVIEVRCDTGYSLSVPEPYTFMCVRDTEFFYIDPEYGLRCDRGRNYTFISL